MQKKNCVMIKKNYINEECHILVNNHTNDIISTVKFISNELHT